MMDIAAADVNGGNAEVAREDSNLNLERGSGAVLVPESSEKSYAEPTKMDDTEINGDLNSPSKKPITSPSARRKMRKIKTNFGGFLSVDGNPPKGIRRKASDIGEVSSGESEEFNGFDNKDSENREPGNLVLKKLIAEVESVNSPKRRKTGGSTWKGIKNADTLIDEGDENTTDSEDPKISMDLDVSSVPVDESSLKSEKSANSSLSMASNRSKKGRLTLGASPGSGRHKVAIDLTNPVYREPFKYGWKRELVYRASGPENSVKRMADIYYYTPEGKKVRSFREVVECLTSKELTIDNFTFLKDPLGINDPDKEIIRDAKQSKQARIRDSFGGGKSTPKMKKQAEVATPIKKPSPKKVAEKVTPVAAKATTPKAVKTTPATFKVKLPAKKSASKKEIKSPPVVPLEVEPAPPQQWASPTTTRRSQPIVEKSPPVKTKRVTKKKQMQPEDPRQHFMVSVCAGYHSLSRIFQYLKVQELLRAARVCKMWRDLAAHPSLWKTVRMKNSQVTDWDGFAETLKSRGTQHLDLRKMLISGESETMWKKFVAVIPRVTSLIKLELCRCPVMVVQEVIKNCPQLKVLSAATIKCDTLNLESIGNLKCCQELRLKAISGMSLVGDLSTLQDLTQLQSLSLTSVTDLGKKNVQILQHLQNLETLELGECLDFPDKFGTEILTKLHKLERLRLEKGQGTCYIFDILEGISKLPNLIQLELVNFDVKNGFDKYLANCKNIKRLLVIPTYISQSATSNNMLLGGVTELSNNLTHFVWGVTLELLRVTELFVDQCNQMNKQISGDSIPVLKPVPCLNLIKDIDDDKDNQKDDKSNLTSPQVDILPLPQLQKLLLTALPKTRVKILKIPFHATWRQSIQDTTQ